jgi:hypothetical protein
VPVHREYKGLRNHEEVESRSCPCAACSEWSATFDDVAEASCFLLGTSPISIAERSRWVKADPKPNLLRGHGQERVRFLLSFHLRGAAEPPTDYSYQEQANMNELSRATQANGTWKATHNIWNTDSR